MEISPPSPRLRSLSSPEYQRTYQACVPCRIRKARCNLGRDGVPPCARCRRQHKDCRFDSDRRRTKRVKDSLPQSRPPSGRPSQGSEDRHDNAGEACSVSHHDSIHSGHQARPISPPSDVSKHDYGILPETSMPYVAHNQQENLDKTPNFGSGYQRQRSPTPSGLASSVMRTVVSSGTDALNILFEAAAHGQNATFNSVDTGLNTQAAVPVIGTSPSTAQELEIPSSSTEGTKLWNSCRFVTMGWLTARDAVWYLDLFFQNIWPLSPIITDFYASHDHHYQLLTQETMLCCTILLISTRYHVLPGLAGLSKSYFLHNRLWKYWQGLMMRIMFGQEKGSQTSIRNLGAIESLLLMSEWHPRSIHFPPEGDGWDVDLVLSGPDQERNFEEQPTLSNQWLQEVIEPARRSDQMSWMLLGSALSLAHELGIFDVEKKPNQHNDLWRRQLRVQKLLHVYVNQLASRLGCTSLMSQNLAYAAAGESASSTTSTYAEQEWDFCMGAWIALTKFLRSASDVFFPSAAVTKQHLLSGRYVGLLDHFRPVLAQWQEKYLNSNVSQSSSFYEVLFIEYQFVKILLNSLGIQAVVERALVDANIGIALEEGRPVTLDDADYEYIQEVISGCCQILERVINLAESGRLRFSPVRFYLRVTSSSVFLLKALSLGVRKAQLEKSLDILDRSIHGLKHCTLDDMHLAPRYASLLEDHVVRLRRHFAASSKTSLISRGVNKPSLDNRSSSVPRESTSFLNESVQDDTDPSFHMDLSLQDLSADDWLSLPFDPSMAPFGLAGSQVFPGFEEGALDFVWNLSS